MGEIGCCVHERMDYLISMRVLGVFLIAVSLAEIGIGGVVFGWISNVHVGAWWAAVPTLIAGILGVVSGNRKVVIAGCVFATIGAIACVVGVIIDGIAASVIGSETGCVNTDTYQTWGTSDGIDEAFSCAGDFSYYSYAHTSTSASEVLNSPPTSAAAAAQSDNGMSPMYYYFFNNYYYNHHFNNYYYNHHFNNYYYNHHFNNYYYNHRYFNNYYYNHHNNYYYNHHFYNNYYYNHHFYNSYYYNHHFYNYNGNTNSMTNKCVCYGENTCYGYDLDYGNDCGLILTSYSNLLISSTAILCVLNLLALSYAILTCASASKTSYNTAGTPVQAVQEVQMMSAFNPAYLQAQQQQQQHHPQPGFARGPVVYITPPTFSGYAVAGSNQNVEVAHALEPNSDDDQMRVSIGGADAQI